MQRNDLGAMDIFRIVAAMLVIIIHTADIPFLGETGNLLLSGVIARIAVPFFFAVTGFFTDFSSAAAIKRLLSKTVLMYAAATAVYLPYGCYFANIKQILFDGSFYHLWYFPALGIGAVIVFALKKLPTAAALSIASALYAFGLCGDSYQTLARNIEPLRKTLDLCSNVFSYTRNGIFFAPLFLMIGSVIGNKTRGGEEEKHLKSVSSSFRFKENCSVKPDRSTPQCFSVRPLKAVIFGAYFAASLAALAAERFLLRGITFAPRDSMFLLLIPCTVFLILTLSSISIKPGPSLRRISMWIYIVHPIIIDLFARINNSLNETGTLNADARHVIQTASISLVTAAVIGIIPAIKRAPSGYSPERINSSKTS